jgi:Xaa-Pro dipeptidase
MREKYLKRLVELINIENLDAALVVPSDNMKFLTGHSPYLCERFQGLFVKKDGSYFYFCNLLTRDEAKDFIGEDKVYSWFDNEVFTDVLKGVFEKEGLMGSTIAVDSTARAFNILDISNNMDVKFINGKELFEAITLYKSEEEIDLLRIAAHKTDKVIQKTIDFIKPGIKELDIKNKIFEYFKDEDMEPEFAIVASGENSAYPHYADYDRIIEPNDIIILDIGGVYKELNSDMTRTIFIGKPTEEMKKVYDIVLEANLAGEKAAEKGTSVRDVDKAAREIIENAGYGEFFTTRLGHGIGYSTHEAPYIKQSSELVLDTAMAFSIEPGIYMPGKFGVRIEDIVVLSRSGKEVLNLTSKDMKITY